MKEVDSLEDGFHACPSCGKKTDAGENIEPFININRCRNCGTKYKDEDITFQKEDDGTLEYYGQLIVKAKRRVDFKGTVSYISDLTESTEWTFKPESFEGDRLMIMNIAFQPSIIEELLLYLGKDPTDEVTVKIHYKDQESNFPILFEEDDEFFLVSPLIIHKRR